ncbi:Mammalian cell entry related domain protein OS=Tsukamurella paurometabola (strain ATCC 8368 / DSM / CCUG 35730 / CIP 100753 / JCM 10117 / KCTC 9821 / NBRC 16120 / NCIMB 702349 / NCTC 13040) OX=521096 GN=Tpau_1241 PE=4 SV=1 [Tsukamurella paurometabola]
MRIPTKRSALRAARTGVITVTAGAMLTGCAGMFNPSSIPAPGQPGGGWGTRSTSTSPTS